MRMNTSDRYARSMIDAGWLIAHLDDPTVRMVEVDAHGLNGLHLWD